MAIGCHYSEKKHILISRPRMRVIGRLRLVERKNDISSIVRLLVKIEVLYQSNDEEMGCISILNRKRQVKATYLAMYSVEKNAYGILPA